MAQQLKQQKGGRCLMRSSHNKSTGLYKRQKIRTEKNKRKRREKHLENNPNDIQAKDNIKRILKEQRDMLS